MSEHIGQFSGSVQFGPQLSVPNSQVKIMFGDTIHVWKDEPCHPNGGFMIPLPVKVVAITECPQVSE